MKEGRGVEVNLLASYYLSLPRVPFALISSKTYIEDLWPSPRSLREICGRSRSNDQYNKCQLLVRLQYSVIKIPFNLPRVRMFVRPHGHLFSSFNRIAWVVLFPLEFSGWDILFLLQWNPVNTVTNGPKKIGRISEVFLQENVWRFLPGGQKK